jgi:ubiquinone/menaquinone biosynthesis C-methylase UbiE
MEMSEHEKQWVTAQGAEMITALGVEEGSSVIDFGCGKGSYTIPLSQVVGKNGNVLAVERNSDEVAVLRERISEFGGQGSITILSSEDVRLESVDDGTIDSVFVFDVLQHIDDWDIFFKSVRRVLKPGGRVHVYPATIPHPGSIDVKRVALAINRIGLQGDGKRQFRMVHNKDMVDDELFTFKSI